MYGTGLLHTNAEKYAPRYTGEFFQTHLESNADYKVLEDKEQALYNQFGETTFEGFMNTLRDLLGKNSQDRECIMRFSANNLTKRIAQFKNVNAALFNEEIQLIFDLSKINKKKIEFPSQIRDNVVIKNNQLYLNMQYNASTIKPVLNKLFSKHYQKGKTTLDNVDKFINELLNNNALSIKVLDKNNDSKDVYVDYVRNTIPNFPWGVRKQDIDFAETMGWGSDIYKELEKAEDKIKDFLLNDLCADGTPALRKAVNTVWDNHFLPKFSADKFFSGGVTGSFISGVIGALGEFQTALIFQYLFDKLNNKGLVKIIGDLYKNKELLRTDVEILRGIGIQVKNYNFNTQEKIIRDIDSTIHPAVLNNYFHNEDFLTFLANYFFNSTYAEFSSGTFMNLKEYLGNYLGKIMNMAVSDSVNIGNTVTFYFINGRYLVPASHIIRAGSKIKEDLKNSINITSAWTAHTDDYFFEGEIDDETGLRRANFSPYWKKVGDVWVAMEGNSRDYNKLINKDISIRTNFNPVDLLIDKYII